jgi:hypothetical protein
MRCRHYLRDEYINRWLGCMVITIVGQILNRRGGDRGRTRSDLSNLAAPL